MLILTGIYPKMAMLRFLHEFEFSSGGVKNSIGWLNIWPQTCLFTSELI
jgi:hypothetical protein